jgi:hypothetical protein
LALFCPPAPVGVFEGSQADISVIAGMMVDKLAFHLPLYWQHQRLHDAGIQVSKAPDLTRCTKLLRFQCMLNSFVCGMSYRAIS